jgi:hypothetical protein
VGGVDRIGSAQLCALRIGHVAEGIDRATRRDEDHPGHDEIVTASRATASRTSRPVIGS